MSLASAEVLLTSHPAGLYSYGDKIQIFADIVPNPTINDLVILYLSCSNVETEIYKEYMYLESSVKKEIIIPVIRGFLGDSKGSCVIKSKIGENKNTISRPFIISDSIEISMNLNNQIEPGKVFVLEGTTSLENSRAVEGFIEVNFGNGKIKANGQITDGNFKLGLDIPENLESKYYDIEFYFYEKENSGLVSNSGKYKTSVFVLQSPTNLEILINEKKISAGGELTGIVKLYDQTGKEIKSKVYLAVKNNLDEIVEKFEISTYESFSYGIRKNQTPGNWGVSAYSEELVTRTNFEILENKELSTTIMNKTLFIENVGNVPYYGVVPVNLGEEIVDVNVNLELGQVARYKISAPTGEYKVSVEGFSSVVSLTGNSIKIEELTTKVGRTKIFLWAFVVLILGVAFYFVFKRAHNKTYFGKRTGKKASKPLELKSLPGPNPLMESKVKADLSLSITGTKQNSPIGCIYIKNYEEIQSGSGGVRETLEMISNLVEEKKGLIYENKGNIFYLIPPIKTKTFHNELPILNLSESIKAVIDEHNKKFKLKIQYGISLNFGTVVTRNEGGTFKFMSMGTLMTTSKKIAIKSVGEILMGDKFKERISKDVKYERVDFEGLSVYKFLGYIKSNNDHSKFIKGFLERQKK